ncbi:MAG: SBBP repeat-containing protein, partial [Bryobacteraceae bacterium]
MSQRTLPPVIVLSVSALASLLSGATHKVPLAIASTFGKVPLHFEQNTGQTDPRVRYLARAAGMTMFVTASESVLVVGKERTVIRMKLDGSRPAQSMRAVEPVPGVSNYLLGNNPAEWRTGVAHYSRVEAREVYPGIDVVYYGNQSRLEYDFVVAPGANPAQIQLAWEGVDAIRMNRDGDLVLATRAGDLVQHKPLVYQERNGRKVEIAAQYRMRGKRVAFELAGYDRSRRLVIDPVLTYSTYVGGNSTDQGLSIAVDSAGAAYLTGEAQSTDFPIGNAVQGFKQPGNSDAFITKLNPGGNSIAYSTY